MAALLAPFSSMLTYFGMAINYAELHVVVHVYVYEYNHVCCTSGTLLLMPA